MGQLSHNLWIPVRGQAKGAAADGLEFDVSRWKRAIGDGRRARTDGRQETEAAIAANAPNCMLDLGRPEYVRVT